MVGCVHTRCRVVFASQFEPLYPSCAEGGSVLPLSLSITTPVKLHMLLCGVTCWLLCYTEHSQSSAPSNDCILLSVVQMRSHRCYSHPQSIVYVVPAHLYAFGSHHHSNRFLASLLCRVGHYELICWFTRTETMATKHVSSLLAQYSCFVVISGMYVYIGCSVCQLWVWIVTWLIIPKSKCKHILVALVLSGTTPTQHNYTYTEAMHVEVPWW